MAEGEVRKHIYVSGRVQGVGFRYRVQSLASDMKITGWAKNLDDGRVEMELQGTEDMIERLFNELQGDRFILIKNVQAQNIPLIEEKRFRVK